MCWQNKREAAPGEIMARPSGKCQEYHKGFLCYSRRPGRVGGYETPPPGTRLVFTGGGPRLRSAGGAGRAAPRGVAAGVPSDGVRERSPGPAPARPPAAGPAGGGEGLPGRRGGGIESRVCGGPARDARRGGGSGRGGPPDCRTFPRRPDAGLGLDAPGPNVRTGRQTPHPRRPPQPRLAAAGRSVGVHPSRCA